jgi:hypothetical protein
MPWIGINKTIRKTVAYIILFKNRIRDILFTQNENKIFFSNFAFFSICPFQILNSLKTTFWYLHYLLTNFHDKAVFLWSLSCDWMNGTQCNCSRTCMANRQMTS